ncbi:l-3-psg2 [Drosophila busckii]|uniref:L-3-psg2 n=1 Tax=Drosophila busckii TaxID=30019 RepID=A0A0M5J3F4_DROBS|nr:l-3-psg2 [Drosophila busckii]
MSQLTCKSEEAADTQKLPTEETQDLEPGELVTPPHKQQQQQQQQQVNGSPALKKILAKDVMNKALRKLTPQIDNDSCKEGVRAKLELEVDAIRRKSNATARTMENGKSTAAANEADDSEGLYSDTDTSQEGEKNLEDVQQARKEKQAEAAAAAATPPPNGPNPFMGLRFHMRPPCFDYGRMAHRMPRMPRGGMRGMRAHFFPRTTEPNRMPVNMSSLAPAATANNVAQNAAGSKPMSTYGPVPPPHPGQAQGHSAKRCQSDVIWTTSQPRLPFIYNVISDCSNADHKSCKPKEPPRAKEAQSKETHLKERNERQRGRSKDKQDRHSGHGDKRRERSREKHNARSKERARRDSKEKHRQRSKERKSSRDKDRARSKAKSHERKRERSKEIKRDKKRERSKEKTKATEASRSKERKTDKERSKEKHTVRSANQAREPSKEKVSEKPKVSSSRCTRSRSKSRKTEEEQRGTTPPALPQPITNTKDSELSLTPPGAAAVPEPAETPKAFDIFAESPPRLNKASSVERPATPTTPPIISSTTPPPKRSMTPPPPTTKAEVVPMPIPAPIPVPAPAPAPAPAAASQKVKKIYSEIHSRIGALLEDDDLHLEALLAKQQLLLKSKKEAPKEALSIKQEPSDAKPANPFKRDTVLAAAPRLSPRRSATRSIKQERHRSSTPPLMSPRHIKKERNLTPPRAAKRQATPVEHSPDTDDYIDSWENDDSQVGGDSNTPKQAAQTSRAYGEDDDSNVELWNAKSTPPPRTQSIGSQATAEEPDKSLINIHELYDKFMKSIKMGGGNATAEDAMDTSKASSLSQNTADEDEDEDSSSSETDSSTSSSSSSSSSSSDDDEADSSSEEQQQQQQQLETQAQSTPALHKKNNVSKDLRKLKSLEDNLARIQMMRENYDSGDDICEELLKMESLFLMQRNAIMEKYRKSELKPLVSEEEQPARPMTPVNNIFDANREAIKLTISPLKLTRKSAIFDKDEHEAPPVLPAPAAFAMEEKFSRPPKEIAIVKPTIMDTRAKLPPHQAMRPNHHQPAPYHQQASHHHDQQHYQHHHQPLKRSRTREREPERSRTRERERDHERSHTRERERSRDRSRAHDQERERSRSRSRSPNRNHFRRPVRSARSKERLATRSPSPRRRRLQHSPRRGSRFSKSRRSMSRSRTRSRSPRRRRPMQPQPGRRRSSLSPIAPGKMSGPRSPAPSSGRRRSYSRERGYSRSPLPFKPPSPPTHYAGEPQQLEQPVGAVLRELPKTSVAVQKGNVLEIVPSEEPVVEQPVIEQPPAPVEPPAEDDSKPKRKRVNFVDNVLPNYESDSEDRKIVQQAIDRALRTFKERQAAKTAAEQRAREQLLGHAPPPPPACPRPAGLDKPVILPKKPRFRYFHFDELKGAIVVSNARMMRSALPQPPSRFDPKYMAMLVKTGRLPMPAFLRQRPPPLPAQTDALLQEFFSKHPPPPLQTMPHYMRGPPPTAPPPLPLPSAAQPIPVLGAQSYSNYPTPAIPSRPTAALLPTPDVPPIVPPIAPSPPVTVAAPPLISTPPPMLPQYLTPPPLPPLSTNFNHLQPVPAMREIIPVDILQKIGPLPKTLDLDGGTAGLDEANADLKQVPPSTLVTS